MARQLAVQLVREFLGGRRAIERICREGSGKQLSQAGWQTVDVLRRAERSAKRKHARDYLKRHDGERPEVPVGRRFLAGQVLGRHVLRCAGNESGPGEGAAAARFERLRKTEVEHFGDLARVGAAQEDVFGLEIAMNHLPPVRGFTPAETPRTTDCTREGARWPARRSSSRSVAPSSSSMMKKARPDEVTPMSCTVTTFGCVSAAANRASD